MACCGHVGSFASVGPFCPFGPAGHVGPLGPSGHAAPVIIKHDWAPLYHPSAGESPR